MEFLRFLAQYRTPLGDALFQAVTWFGEETLVLVVICWLYWCKDKKLAYTIGLTYFFSGLLVQGLKITFRIPRPWVLDPDFQAVPSAVPGATGYSFPSGHTQSGTALYASLALSSSKIWQKSLCVLLFLAIGFSRMYLGCHTPQDVLTAMALSLLCSLLAYRFLYRRPDSFARSGRISCLLTVCAVFLLYILHGCTPAELCPWITRRTARRHPAQGSASPLDSIWRTGGSVFPQTVPARFCVSSSDCWPRWLSWKD